MTKRIVLLLTIFLIGFFTAFGQNKTEGQIKYASKIIIAKLFAGHSAFFKDVDLNSIKIESVTALFPYHSPVILENNQVDLSLIYSLKISSSINIETVIQDLQLLDVFEYVERQVVHEVALTPNDPEINKQDYLTQINAYNAWNVSTGSTSIKVGIVDSGTDMDHPDLVTEMYQNTGDPVNGVDDDNDGYIDNFNGWDFFGNDNNPQIDLNAHGIHVAGIAVAATNNNVGVASVGFNSQFIPIRAGNGTAITHGYQGVVYAADMGCEVINCSWGSFGFTSFGEDAVNYATYNKGSLVVAAAGNSGLNRMYYPAGYQSVLGVASVKRTDEKSSFSNYGNWIEISAPGEGVYSCVDAGLYNYNTGTSMASPVVAGAAALLKSVFPQLTPKQLTERLKTTSQNIDGQNTSYLYKIGTGRLDLGAAVSGIISAASVVFENKVISNKVDNVFKAGDSLLISGTFTNYLASSNNVTATISSSSPNVFSNITSYNLGAMGSLDQTDNFSFPFSFQIKNSTPVNTWVTFELIITDGVFSNTQLIDVLVNVDYLNIAINNMASTLGSMGQFGYNDRNQTQGLGVQFKNGSSQLFEGGLMIGTNADNFTRVMDRVRNGSNSWDTDFEVVASVKEITPALRGEYQVEGIFNDSNGLANMIGLDVLQRGYASTITGHDNYIVLEYTLINSSNDIIENVNAGLFADFDIADYDKNAVYTDLTRFYTYTISTEPGSPLYGIQLLTPTVFRSYGLDNIAGGAGGIDILNGFSNFDKFSALTSNRYGAGYTDIQGNDVIQVTSTGGFDVPAGDSVTVAFALIAAESKMLLDVVADSAYFAYNGSVPNSVAEPTNWRDLVVAFPNPTNNRVTLDVSSLNHAGTWGWVLKDLTGKELLHLEQILNKTHTIDLFELNSGVYLIDIQTSEGVSTIKLIKN
jgi:serine protease